MNKIKMFAPVSLDGFISRIDGDIDWTIRYLRGRDYGMKNFMDATGSVVFNRGHYVMLRSYDIKWPYAQLPCYVITRQPFACPQSRNIHFLLPPNGAKLNDPGLLDELKKNKGDIWLAGNNDLTAQFMEMGLIDEVTLLVLPVTLGNGLRLITAGSGESNWLLSDTRKYDNGVMRLTYCRNKEETQTN